MDEKIIFLTILGMALVTYLPRALPVWLLASRPLPAPVITWLRYVPAAVLAAMLFPSLLLPEARQTEGYLYLYAALPTLLVAWKWRSLFGAVVVGMAFVAAGRLLLGL